MDLSLKWLKEFVDLDIDPKDFSARMTMSGSKVESWRTEGEEISRVVVGRVLSVSPHEDSDHLVVCQIDIGGEAPLQIVTGASNVLPNALVPVACDGSTLPGGVKIKKGKLRGVVSEGMLCSLGELGLTLHDFPYAVEDGIFLIEENCKPGDDIKTALGLDDTIVEFEITPNRPDCLSVIGLARETACTYSAPLKLGNPVVKGGFGNASDYLKVKVDAPDLCSRYTAKVIRNVKIAPSPRWMRERLRASGVRPINNLVDITNYVMLEYGQPLHAFDAACIDGNEITVRRAGKSEIITTLDSQQRKLSDHMLVIADNNKAVAVAGVMGGENSEITDNTKTVIIESACFLGSAVRIAARDLGMRTDASARFEKGLDPKNTLAAANRACELVELLGAGEVCDGIIDIDNSPKEPVQIALDSEWINKFLNINLSKKEMEDILNPLGLKVDGDIITVPSWRGDVVHKADVAEEIARFYGYDKIPVSQLNGIADARVTARQAFDRSAETILQACGCYEIATYSFISPKYYDKINLPSDSPLRECVVITNPLGEDTSVMRTTTLPSMLEVLSHNFNHKNEEFCAYEIGKEYIKTGEDTLPLEVPQITIGAYGKGYDFFAVKGIVAKLLERLYIKDTEFVTETQNPTFHPGRCAKIVCGQKEIGIIGEAHPAVAQNYSISAKTYLAKLNLDMLFEAADKSISYKESPRFPAATRDLALICDDLLPIGEIEKTIKKFGGKHLEAVKLFDVYKGEQIPSGKKSVAYSIVLRSADATLTDTEADSAIKKILKGLSEINVTLRV